MLYATDNPLAGKEHFAGALFKLDKFGLDTDSTIYTGLVALGVNLAVAAVVTAVVRAADLRAGTDETVEEDYHVEAGDPLVRPMPADTSIPAPAGAGARRPR
jgi:SSS family solute:Na+ symporter